LQRSVFVKNGAKGGVVACDKVVEAVRWISYQTGLADVSNEAYDVNRAGATVRATSCWIVWMWCCIETSEEEIVIRWSRW
jgi:hypothetical protein